MREQKSDLASETERGRVEVARKIRVILYRANTDSPRTYLAAFETHAPAVASGCQCTRTSAAAPLEQALAADGSSSAAARVLPAAACSCGSISQTCPIIVVVQAFFVFCFSFCRSSSKHTQPHAHSQAHTLAQQHSRKPCASALTNLMMSPARGSMCMCMCMCICECVCVCVCARH